MAGPRMAGLEAGSLKANGVTLAFHHGGPPDGPPVLLWHGFLGTSHAWRKVAPALVQAGCAVLVPDMRGYGDSNKPEGTEGYDARGLADDFRALGRQTGFGGGRPITLVAHDMGAPPALVWAGEHPDEVERLVYIEEPVFVADALAKAIAYTPDGTRMGGLWWWFMAFAPDLPEALIVGNEERFLRWFYQHYTANPATIEDEAIAEYLRTFAGREGVLGALGCYRAAFATTEQTQPFTQAKIHVPVHGIGGAGSQGEGVAAMLRAVAADVTGESVPDCGHFIPEEKPDAIVRAVLAALPSR